MSLREILSKFDIEPADLPESFCCGDPIKSVNQSASHFLGARILALVNLTRSENLLVPCNRCHFTISEAKDFLKNAPGNARAEKIMSLLEEEGLHYNPELKIWHTIDFMYDQVGIPRIKKAVKRPLKGLKVASHPGCQILRYTDLGRVDDAENPKKLDELLRALGVETVEYAEKLDCCGAALMRSHADSALSLAGSKLKAVQNLSVNGIVVSCPDCELMFDAKQKDASATVGTKLSVPSIYYTQLLGLALGIEERKLGLHLNQSPVEDLLTKILN